MNAKRIDVAILGLAVLLLPTGLVAQMDSNASSSAGAFPVSSTGMSQMNGQGNSSGSQAGSQVNQPGSMRDSLGAPGLTGQQMLDKQFVRSAAEGSIADVKLGTLATEKGGPAVKELAQKMVDDHTAMGKEMSSVADAMGVMLPSKMSRDQQKEYDKLQALSGKDFDTEYLSYLAKVHFETLHSFHMEASVAQNEELAAEVVKSLGMMHQHLGMIVSVAKDEGVVLPPRPPRPAPTTASK